MLSDDEMAVNPTMDTGKGTHNLEDMKNEKNTFKV